ncbi:MAG: 50S ribosomal protein L18 [Bacteroidales bacterium]|jgi:large subunit ribosomal protein L18|nr:50S ribosomal protein L18 [Bacteroidales bacterium]MBQ5541111.1 50S ribosomal protein L18 [Bacteroidales bacterium]MBR4678080.1 50S ribosomal protein L18 [Bacteroidales bacterium]MEE3447447.1 50S ribosomal protein L18 [Bacteroidales bacterium]
MALTKQERRQRIKYRIRKKLSGTPERPRLCVFRSNKNIFAQLIDDVSGKTLVATSSRVKEISEKKVTKIEQAALVGKAIAEKAKAAGYEAVVFDRNGYLYHGRVKSLAEAAREGGLNF